MNEEQLEKPNKGYEVAYLLSPHASEEDVRQWLEGLSRAISEKGGTMREMPEPKRQILSYPVNKNKQAFFGWAIFDAPAEAPEAIHEHFRHDQKLLRMLIIEEQKNTKPRRIPSAPKVAETPTTVEESRPEEKSGGEEVLASAETV